MPQRHLKIRPYALLMILMLSSFWYASAKEATVFDVRRPLAMENGQETQKDYFINAGSVEGLKKGMLVTVTRRQALYDQYLNKSPGDLVVNVGSLRIIHVQSDMSVARLESLQDRGDTPVVEFEAIMVGDKVDLSTARMSSRKTAALDAAASVEAVVGTIVEAVAPPQLAPIQQEKDFSSVTPSAADGVLVAPKASVNVNTAM